MTTKKPTTKKQSKKKSPVKKQPVKKKVKNKSLAKGKVNSDNLEKLTENNQLKKIPIKKGRGLNGGKRKGSGRKKGTATLKTREIADKLAESDEMSPLEYMLNVLRETIDDVKKKYNNGDIDAVQYAVEIEALQRRRDNAAEKAAPYIHPRLSSIAATIDDGEHERWLAMIEGLT